MPAFKCNNITSIYNISCQGKNLPTFILEEKELNSKQIEQLLSQLLDRQLSPHDYKDDKCIKVFLNDFHFIEVLRVKNLYSLLETLFFTIKEQDWKLKSLCEDMLLQKSAPSTGQSTTFDLVVRMEFLYEQKFAAFVRKAINVQQTVEQVLELQSRILASLGGVCGNGGRNLWKMAKNKILNLELAAKKQNPAHQSNSQVVEFIDRHRSEYFHFFATTSAKIYSGITGKKPDLQYAEQQLKLEEIKLTNLVRGLSLERW